VTAGFQREGQTELADGNLAARVLLTIAALGYRAATIKADFNVTHAPIRNGRHMRASMSCGRS
jgi:hypothetical protein